MEICCIAHSVGQLPPGFELKFNPTPEILVCNYLLPKIRGELLPCTAAVKECDLYGSKKPEQIWQELGGVALGKGEDVFFFATLTKTNRNFKRTNDFGGTWTGKGGDKVFSRNVNEEKKPIARRRRLVYAPPKKEEEPHKEKSELEQCGWTVFEYTVDVEDSEWAKDLFECSSYSTQVLCQLRKQEQNHHETTTTGKRKRHDSVNQDSHTDAGDPSDPDYNQLPPIIENWEVQNFNTGGGVPPDLNYTQPSDPSLEDDKEWDFLRCLTPEELMALYWVRAYLDQLEINQDSHTNAGDPSDPDYNQLPQILDRNWEDILRLLDRTPDQSQVQDSQCHNPDQVQVQDSITDDVVPPSQLVSNSQHNWGTYLVPQSLSDIPDIPDIGATSSVFEVSWEHYFLWEDYFRSNPSRIPDPKETEI